jgi:C4-dicarboxylate-specific signal transduction histidine kinase
VFLALVAGAVAATSAALLLVLGLPLAARQALSVGALASLGLAAALAGTAVGALLLVRAVARPVERLLGAAANLRGEGGLPVLGAPEPDGAPGALALPRAAVAFERVAAQLAAERARLAAKVDELTCANAALADARASLVRSERLATVGRLAAGLAHEVGNPLGAITGYAELARARLPAGAHPDLGDAVDRIAAAAARIDRTVRDLLDFARPSPAAVAPIQLAPAVDAALRLARVQPRFRRVEVELRIPADLPAIEADEHHLAQVLLNLFLNAGDAMGGEGRVELAARAEGDRVELEVADEGPGIAGEDLALVFDPFFTTKEPGAGTGLGLAICHRIMESLGGEIAAANGPRGAVFLLRLRAAPAQASSRPPAGVSPVDGPAGPT